MTDTLVRYAKAQRSDWYIDHIKTKCVFSNGNDLLISGHTTVSILETDLNSNSAIQNKKIIFESGLDFLGEYFTNFDLSLQPNGKNSWKSVSVGNYKVGNEKLIIKLTILISDYSNNIQQPLAKNPTFQFIVTNEYGGIITEKKTHYTIPYFNSINNTELTLKIPILNNNYMSNVTATITLFYTSPAKTKAGTYVANSVNLELEASNIVRKMVETRQKTTQGVWTIGFMYEYDLKMNAMPENVQMMTPTTYTWYGMPQYLQPFINTNVILLFGENSNCLCYSFETIKNVKFYATTTQSDLLFRLAFLRNNSDYTLDDVLTNSDTATTMTDYFGFTMTALEPTAILQQQISTNIPSSSKLVSLELGTSVLRFIPMTQNIINSTTDDNYFANGNMYIGNNKNIIKIFGEENVFANSIYVKDKMVFLPEADVSIECLNKIGHLLLCGSPQSPFYTVTRSTTSLSRYIDTTQATIMSVSTK